MADIMKVEEMPILLRREVEARILKPFLEAFEKEVGKERTKEIVIDVIKKQQMKKAESQQNVMAATL